MNAFYKSTCATLLLLLCLCTSDAVMEISKIQPYSGILRPNFSVSVYPLVRSLSISAVTESAVRVRLCYQQRAEICSELSPKVLELVTAKYPTVNLTFPFLLPCLCVQVYFYAPDAARTPVCPFENRILDGPDIWRSSTVIPFAAHLRWTSLCPIKPSASLCWQNQRLSPGCVDIHNSTLHAHSNTRNPLQTDFNTSCVDKHPNTCVKLSVNNSSWVHCPFKPGLIEWQMEVVPASLYMCVYLTSAIPASFSAQLCVLEGWDCVPSSAVHSISMEEGENKKKLMLPFTYLKAQLCVQVWRTYPVQYGWRLFCPEYSHKRWGLIAMAMVVSGLGLAYLSCHAIQRFSALQLNPRPVLLVCSSEQTEQLTAVCVLASILQGELSTGVHMAYLAHASIAKLGPLPWLYGQCEAVRAAGGRVLVVWSPEGSWAYRSWWGSATEKRTESMMEKKTCSGEKEKQRREDSHEENDASGHTEENERVGSNGSCWMAGRDVEPSAVTMPVLRAALAYMQGALQRPGCGQGHGFALVSFQGLCSSQDIPYELKEIPLYCLPGDFKGLVQELHDCSVDSRWCCFHRLASIIQVNRMASRLAHKLQPWLPSVWNKKQEDELPILHKRILSSL